MSAAQIAKATLMRLAQGRLEPTPENYARAWVEAGGAVPRLKPVETVEEAAAHWPKLAADALKTVTAALPPDVPQTEHLSHTFTEFERRWREGRGADESSAGALGQAFAQAQSLFLQRHQLVDELGKLVRSLTEGLTELAEDQSWAQGQADALRATLDGDEALSVRGVRSAADMLGATRRQQQKLRAERDKARAALRALVDGLSQELDALGGQTGRFSDELVRCTDDLERIESREQMGHVLHKMLTASRSVQTEVAEASARISASREQAETLNTRVQQLEDELRKLSEEVSTDALTQVSNRRGLSQAFEVESARAQREGTPLSIGLIDIDNFKKLNDSLGHAAGDEALKALASQVRTALRPTDHVARFGGEEFVVLLPGTALAEGQEVLTRVQRTMSMGLFMHEGREQFVTFSAGITAWQPGEHLGSALERADAALYQAKRTGKNKTCTG